MRFGRIRGLVSLAFPRFVFFTGFRVKDLQLFYREEILPWQWPSFLVPKLKLFVSRFAFSLKILKEKNIYIYISRVRPIVASAQTS